MLITGCRCHSPAYRLYIFDAFWMVPIAIIYSVGARGSVTEILVYIFMGIDENTSGMLMMYPQP